MKRYLPQRQKRSEFEKQTHEISKYIELESVAEGKISFTGKVPVRIKALKTFANAGAITCVPMVFFGPDALFASSFLGVYIFGAASFFATDRKHIYSNLGTTKNRRSVKKFLLRQGQQMDDIYGWRPRLHMPHPKGRYDVYDRFSIDADLIDDMYALTLRRWSFSRGEWMLANEEQWMLFDDLEQLAKEQAQLQLQFADIEAIRKSNDLVWQASSSITAIYDCRPLIRDNDLVWAVGMKTRKARQEAFIVMDVVAHNQVLTVMQQMMQDNQALQTMIDWLKTDTNEHLVKVAVKNEKANTHCYQPVFEQKHSKYGKSFPIYKIFVTEELREGQRSQMSIQVREVSTTVARTIASFSGEYLPMLAQLSQTIKAVEHVSKAQQAAPGWLDIAQDKGVARDIPSVRLIFASTWGLIKNVPSFALEDPSYQTLVEQSQDQDFIFALTVAESLHTSCVVGSTQDALALTNHLGSASQGQLTDSNDTDEKRSHVAMLNRSSASQF